MSSGDVFSIQDLINRAIGVVKLRERTRSTAVNNLLEVLESETEDIDSLYLTSTFALRQAARGVMDMNMAKEVAKNLMEIARSGVSNKKQVARKFLGLVKWIFEVVEESGLRDLRSVNSLDDLIEVLGGRL